MSLNDKRCKCPFAIKMNGDGCQYCQPQTAIDLLSSVVDDLEEESDQQDARSRRLEAENEALRKSVEELRAAINGHMHSDLSSIESQQEADSKLWAIIKE